MIDAARLPADSKYGPRSQHHDEHVAVAVGAAEPLVRVPTAAADAMKSILAPLFKPEITDLIEQFLGQPAPDAHSIARAHDLLLQEHAVLKVKAVILGVDPHDHPRRYPCDSPKRTVPRDQKSNEAALEMIRLLSSGMPASAVMLQDQQWRGYMWGCDHDSEEVAGVFTGIFDAIDWDQETRQAVNVLESERPFGRLDRKQAADEGDLTPIEKNHIEKVERGEVRWCVLIDGLYLHGDMILEATKCPTAARRLQYVAREMRRKRPDLARPLEAPTAPLAPLLIDLWNKAARPFLQFLQPHLKKNPEVLALVDNARLALSRRDAREFRGLFDQLKLHLAPTFQSLPTNATEEWLWAWQKALVILELSAPHASASDQKGVVQAQVQAPEARQPDVPAVGAVDGTPQLSREST